PAGLVQRRDFSMGPVAPPRFVLRPPTPDQRPRQSSDEPEPPRVRQSSLRAMARRECAEDSWLDASSSALGAACAVHCRRAAIHWSLIEPWRSCPRRHLGALARCGLVVFVIPRALRNHLEKGPLSAFALLLGQASPSVADWNGLD